MNAIDVTKGIVLTLFLLGTLLSLLSTFGVLRLPDVYNRNHAATKVATLGTMSVLIGAFLYFWIVDGIISAKILLGIVFVFVTMPVGGHLISRAAYYTGVPLSDQSVEDELSVIHRQKMERDSIDSLNVKKKPR